MNADPSSWLVSTVQFGLAGLALLLPLGWLWPRSQFRSSRRAVVMGASLFWPAFALVLLQTAWHGYYQFFYPPWMKWGAAVIALAVYSVDAFGVHWLASRLPGQPLAWFCLLVGILAAFEHLMAWVVVDLPNRVPSLRGTPLGVAMAFAFFEYQVYWAVALWLGWLLTRMAALRHTGGSLAASLR